MKGFKLTLALTQKPPGARLYIRCHKWRSTILLTFPYNNLKENQTKRRVDKSWNSMFWCDTMNLPWGHRRDDEAPRMMDLMSGFGSVNTHILESRSLIHEGRFLTPPQLKMIIQPGQYYFPVGHVAELLSAWNALCVRCYPEYWYERSFPVYQWRCELLMKKSAGLVNCHHDQMRQ